MKRQSLRSLTSIFTLKLLNCKDCFQTVASLKSSGGFVWFLLGFVLCLSRLWATHDQCVWVLVSYLFAGTWPWCVGWCGRVAIESSELSCGYGWACCYCPLDWQTTNPTTKTHRPAKLQSHHTTICAHIH